MRVLLIAHEANLNGATKSMLNLIDTLRGRVEYVVALPVKEGSIIDELENRGISYFYCPMCAWMDQGRKTVFGRTLSRIKWLLWRQPGNCHSARMIEKMTVEMHIDLIHTNTSVINVGALVHRRSGIPHVWHIREFGQEDFGMRRRCSDREFYRMIDESSAVITVSNALAEKYRQHLRHQMPVVIYNGVGSDNRIDASLKTSCRNRPLHFLTAGALHPGKGQDLAVKAAIQLLEQGVYDFVLYIAGRGDTKWLTDLEGFSEEHIILLGQVENMPGLRKDMDVELVCSRSEAFGRVTVEAMMGYMPVIGSDSGGTPELIVDGVTGLLFRPGNVVDLAEKMKYFIDNREMTELMGAAAQEYAMTHFTMDICAESIYKVYDTVMSRSGGGCINQSDSPVIQGPFSIRTYSEEGGMCA